MVMEKGKFLEIKKIDLQNWDTENRVFQITKESYSTAEFSWMCNNWRPNICFTATKTNITTLSMPACCFVSDCRYSSVWKHGSIDDIILFLFNRSLWVLIYRNWFIYTSKVMFTQSMNCSYQIPKRVTKSDQSFNSISCQVNEGYQKQCLQDLNPWFIKYCNTSVKSACNACFGVCVCVCCQSVRLMC